MLARVAQQSAVLQQNDETPCEKSSLFQLLPRGVAGARRPYEMVVPSFEAEEDLEADTTRNLGAALQTSSQVWPRGLSTRCTPV